MLPAPVTTSTTVIIVTQYTGFTSICEGIITIGKSIVAITNSITAIPLISTSLVAESTVIIVAEQIGLATILIILVTISPARITLFYGTLSPFTYRSSIIYNTYVRTTATIIYILHNIRLTAIIVITITVLIIISAITVTILTDRVLRAAMDIPPFEAPVIVPVHTLLPAHIGLTHSCSSLTFIKATLNIQC
jgi:hypothetical protein